MGQARVVEHFFDWSGGRNSTANPDTLKDNELVDCTNARTNAITGSITKRTGSRRMHATSLTAGGADTITGITQFRRDASNLWLVAIAGGVIHQKKDDFGVFSTTGGVIFSTTAKTEMKPARDSTSGSAFNLYIADGATVRRFTGAAQTQIDGTNSIPTADKLIHYHQRMFFTETVFPNQLTFTALGLPEDADTGSLITDGGATLVGLGQSDTIQAMETIGSSLLIFSDDAIHRFTGYSHTDIRLDQDTEGVSNEVGAVGQFATTRVEGTVHFLSDRGPMICNEKEVRATGQKVENDFDNLKNTSSAVADSVVGWHRGRREVWFAVQGSGDTGNRTVFIYNVRKNSWNGPFTYPFAITCMSSFEDAAGDEWIVAGCADGFVRHMDTGSTDDVLSDGTGGSAYTMTVDFKPLIFGLPGITKTMRHCHVQADLPTGAALTMGFSGDGGSFTSTAIVETGTVSLNYRVDDATQGKRIRMRMTDASSVIPVVHGITLEAFNTNRR